MSNGDDDLLPRRKVSRYRAQRIQAADNLDNAPPLPSLPSQVSPTVATSPEDPLTRSRSRYRPRAAANTSQNIGQKQERERIPAIPELPSAPLKKAQSQQELSPRAHRPPTSQLNATTRDARPQPTKEPDQTNPPRLSRRVDSGTTLQSTDSQNSIQRTATLSPSIPLSPPPTSELFPPSRPEPLQPVKPKDGPPASYQITATKVSRKYENEKVIEHDNEKVAKSGFSFFRRKRDQRTNDTPPKTAASGSSDDGPVLAAVDAPVSAVNAGERRVLLECGAYKMMYPVTPTTTPVDLIRSAAITMSDPINVKSAVLLEYFTSVGVHRAIRRYEHIRDVMNSWDNDTQNSLLLIDPGTSSSETELGITGVPKTKPGNLSWTLYYSQSVGKWDKRLVHLKRDGQLTYQKDPKKPNEQTNICHLSDFDIYTPTQEKMKKKVKPPKKFCYAIKSQQKSIMFENTTNFVHFFSVADKTVAEAFCGAVQSWRSWYLVNVMGEGTTVDAANPSSKIASVSKAPAVQAHRKIDSVDGHYQLGTFSPLVDLDHFNSKRLSSFGPLTSNDQPASQTVRRQRQAVLAEDEPLANMAKRTSLDNKFVNGSHTQRRQPSGDLNGSLPAQPRTHRSLVDLTPQRQQSRRGQGYQPERRLDGGLIAAAANPDAGTFSHQRMSSELGAGSALPGRQSIDRVQSVRRSRPSAELEGFTGDGLLAQTQNGWGDGHRGRGVIDGAHARGPMVTMSEEDSFAQGSLLQKVERRRGPRGPIIDRERTVESEVKTGERMH